MRTLEALFEEINNTEILSGIELLLNQQLGLIDKVKINVSLEDSAKYGKKIYFESNELKDYSGIIQYKSLKVISSYTWFDCENTNILFINMRFWYTHIEGGSNGCDCCTICYDVNEKKWTILD